MNLSIRARPAVRGVRLGRRSLLLTTLAACSDDKETLASWSENGGQKHLTTIAKDVTTLIQVSDPIGMPPTAASQCSQVLDDVKAARAYAELPDKTAQATWKKALDKVGRAASRCLRNAKTGTGTISLVETADVQSSFHDVVIEISPSQPVLNRAASAAGATKEPRPRRNRMTAPMPTDPVPRSAHAVGRTDEGPASDPERDGPSTS